MQDSTIKPGMVLLSAQDERAWFLFYHNETGTAAFDLTTEHPEIGWKIFESSLKFSNMPLEKTVLLGGPERKNDALIILHETDKQSEESFVIDENFSFLAYTLALLPDMPPVIHTNEPAPTEVKLQLHVDFLIVLGHRQWLPDILENELKSGLWYCMEPQPFDIFASRRENRRENLRNKIN